MNKITVQIIWIPKHCGGRRQPLGVGAFAEVRWARYVSDWLRSSWGAKIIEINSSAVDGLVEVVLFAPPLETIDQSWLEPGQQIELLNGPNIVAIGVIK